MKPSINIATELNDETFHFTRTSVYSFLQNNPWFDGEILYLTHSSKPISSKNLTILQKLYNKINLIRFEDYPELSHLEKSVLVNTNILKLSLLFQEEPVFYFKNSSLFIKDFLDLLNHNKSMITPEFDLCLFNKDIKNIELSNKLEYQQILNLINDSGAEEFNSKDYSNSTSFSDKKFKQYSNILASCKVIIFDFNSPDCTKIQQVWLQKNKESLQYSEKPINIPRSNNINQSNSGNLKIAKILKAQAPIDYVNPLTHKMINSVNQINGQQVFESYEKTIEYFKDKNICIVANSSELLKYQYGEFIDSHDIIIRFNGYKILPEKTGIRTDVHCVFRTFFESSIDYIDYKIVISSNINHWLNTILKFHSKDAISKKYKLLDFNYPSGQQLSKAKCGNIKIPTSGLAAFVFLHSLGISKNVKLIGFNAYNGGDSTTILRNNSDDQLAGAHDYRLEQAYWSTRFDEVLPGVLKFKY